MKDNAELEAFSSGPSAAKSALNFVEVGVVVDCFTTAAAFVAETIKDIANKEGLSNHQLLIAAAIFEIENREALEASDLLLLNTLLYLQHTEK